MRSLAVRVSTATKCDASKKSQEIRESPLDLPPTKVFQLELDDADAMQCLRNFRNDYASADAIDQQLLSINTIVNALTKKHSTTLSDEILLQILSDIYFHAPLKHPIRSITSRALQRDAASNGNLVITAIFNTLVESDVAVNKRLSADEVDVTTIVQYVAALIGCFENFEKAIAAIQLHMEPMLRTIGRIIDTLIQTSRDAVHSPAKRSQHYVYLHNAIRVVLFAVQKYQETFTDAEILSPILQSCWNGILEDSMFGDLPLDTKVNCAIMKVYYDRFSKQKTDAVGDQILAQYQEVSATESCETILLSKKVYLGIAVINTMAEKDKLDANLCIAIQMIVEHLIDVGRTYVMDSGVMMAITRGLMQFSRKTLNNIKKATAPFNEADAEHLKLAARKCLDFVWLNADHCIDCVKYAIKDLLKSLLRMGHENKIFGQIINDSFAMIKSRSTSSSLTSLLLDNLSQIIRAERIIQEVPNIRDRVLEDVLSDISWSNCYERLMVTNSWEIDFAAWCDRWINPLIYIDPSEWRDDQDKMRAIRNLFERALKAKPEAAEFILGKKDTTIDIYLYVLWMMRKSGRRMYTPDNYQLSDDVNVARAKLHQTDEVRILAFRILTDCHKLSQKFPVNDLHAILEFLKYNCNTQNPTTRQEITTSIRRTMERIECGYLAAQKSNPEDNAELFEYYQQFLIAMIQFCCEWCLFNGANFGRRAIGLTTLHRVIETWQKILPENRCIYTEQLWITLQRTLADTYAINANVAIRILSLCKQFYSHSNLLHDLDSLKRLITTFKPQDTETAAHYIVFASITNSHFNSIYEAVVWCEKLMDEGIEIAEKSLIQMTRYNSLYGSILSVRQLLVHVDFAKMTEPEEIAQWRSFFQRMIPRCKRLTNVEAPIVNSSAPEGHLPADLNDKSHLIAGENDDYSHLNHIKITAQMILVCAWRTVRETALLMGEIALHIPITTSEHDYGLITIDQLLGMGQHFQLLLAETVHRGAFEQSFVGFSNLCLRLWRSHESPLHSYPSKLVEKMAAIIAGEKVEDTTYNDLDVSKLCVTRRSAGIPFMIQAIVASEVQVCSNSTVTFSMRTFLHIARTGLVQESRTHALNILRALFKCTELGEAVSDYISDGIECSIRGYNAPSWPERNSSTLLFSALMTRIFGVQRTKQIEGVNIKNKMTGHVFFVRYPRLYDFFYAELEAASKAIQQNERPPRLHPLLLLIARLYPSGESDSNSKLLSFVPFISTCSSSPELVTRELSAKSIVALIPSNGITQYCLGLLHSMKTENALNALHGYTLQILHLLRSTKHQKASLSSDELSNLLCQIAQMGLPHNNIIAKAFLDILIETIMKPQIQLHKLECIDQLFVIRDAYVQNTVQANQYQDLTRSYVRKSFTIFNLLLSACFAEVDKTVITQPIGITGYGVLETQLNIMLLIWRKTACIPLNYLDVHMHETEFVDYLETNEKLESIDGLLPSIEDLYRIIRCKNEYHSYSVIKAYEILSIVLHQSVVNDRDINIECLTINQLIELMNSTLDENVIDDVSTPIWKYINAQLLRNRDNGDNIDEKMVWNIIKNIRNMCSPEKLPDLRRTAAETISLVLAKYIGHKLSTNLDLLINICDLLLGLLHDDDMRVRNRASEIIMTLVSESSMIEEHLGKVIPLAAEDHLLSWLDAFLSKIGKKSACTNWIKLMQRIISKDDSMNCSSRNEDNDDLVDIDLFDTSESNAFEEPIYTLHKCFVYLDKYIEDQQNRKDILSKFPCLLRFDSTNSIDYKN